MRAQLRDLQTSLKDQESTLKRLDSQLDDLVQAKKDHEEELLQKFAALLNAKKLKIRDQQRLLASAKIDPSSAAQVQSSRKGRFGHKPATSRAGKRKASSPSPDEDSNDDESGESAIVGEDNEERIGEARDGTSGTPDTATEEEASDEDLARAITPASRARNEGVTSTAKASQSRISSPAEADSAVSPTRELPFNVKTTQRVQSQKSSQQAQNEDDDETEDDEL